MECSSCSAELKDGTRFCNQCGADQAALYAECDGKVRYEVKEGAFIQADTWVFSIKAGLLDLDGWSHQAKVSGKVHYAVPNGDKVKQGQLVATILKE